MASKRNAKEIVDFALVPVRAWPDASYSWHGGGKPRPYGLFPNTYLQTYKALISKRKKLIDDIKAWNAIKPVDRRYRLQKTIVEFLLKIGTDLHQAIRLYHKRLFRTELTYLNNCVWKGFLHRFDRRCCCYDHTFSIPYI